jgi:hypothetical protein
MSFSALLNGYTGTSASGETPYTGLFMSQYAGTLTGSGPCSGQTSSITNILNCEAVGGTVAGTWAATEFPTTSTAAPEPIGALLFGSGLAGMVLFGRCFCRSRIGAQNLGRGPKETDRTDPSVSAGSPMKEEL